ncbi:MAG: hypothetical protein AB7N71_04160 [Phycisphaerae bacterium]
MESCDAAVILVQYRAGEFESAALNLALGTEECRKVNSEPPASGLAFGAMANFRLKKFDESSTLLAQLRELCAEASDYVCKAKFLREAEELIEGSAATSHSVQTP